MRWEGRRYEGRRYEVRGEGGGHAGLRPRIHVAAVTQERLDHSHPRHACRKMQRCGVVGCLPSLKAGPLGHQEPRHVKMASLRGKVKWGVSFLVRPPRGLPASPPELWKSRLGTRTRMARVRGGTAATTAMRMR